MNTEIFRRRVTTLFQVVCGEVVTLEGHHGVLYLKGMDYESRYVLTSLQDGRSYLYSELGIDNNTACIVFEGSFVENISPEPEKSTIVTW